MTCAQPPDSPGSCQSPAKWYDEFHGAACDECKQRIDQRKESGEGVVPFWSEISEISELHS